MKSVSITDQQRQAFLRRQTEKFGTVFVAKDGLCYKCQDDVIAHHIANANDGSKVLVTGCPFCLRTICD